MKRLFVFTLILIVVLAIAGCKNDAPGGEIQIGREYDFSGVTQVKLVNGHTGYESAPHIISASVKGVRAEVLLHALEERGIYVSSGSACASNKNSFSETLRAIGLEKEYLDATVRFSFSVFYRITRIS